MEFYNPVRGMKDFYPTRFNLYDFVVNSISRIAVNHGFDQIQTPIVEYSELFNYALGGEKSDIIKDEMYSFLDRGGKSLTLRPEFTAAVVRHVISNSSNYPNKIKKLYSVGPLFRYDRPQKGRYRQFHQANFEYIGEDNIGVDIELLYIVNEIMKSLGIEYQMEINSLGDSQVIKDYTSVLKEYFMKNKEYLSEKSQSKIENNTLRILDSKFPKDIEICNNIPSISKHYTPEISNRLNCIINILSDMGIKFVLNHKLVRGLEYYSGIIFECTTKKLGTQNAIAAGGRYNGLYSQISNNKYDSPAIGFAVGIERIMELVDNPILNSKNKIGIIYLDKNTETYQYIFKILNTLSPLEISCSIEHQTEAKMKIRINSLLKQGVRYVIFIGESEVNSNSYTLKDLNTGKSTTGDYDILQKEIETIYKK